MTSASLKLGMARAQEAGGEEARGEAQLAAAYALRRGLLGGACTQADVARARLLLGMARAQGRREAFVKACAEGT